MSRNPPAQNTSVTHQHLRDSKAPPPRRTAHSKIQQPLSRKRAFWFVASEGKKHRSWGAGGGGGGLGGAVEGMCACLTPTACGDVCVICVCVCRSEGEPTGASITVSTLTAFKANSRFLGFLKKTAHGGLQDKILCFCRHCATAALSLREFLKKCSQKHASEEYLLALALAPALQTDRRRWCSESPVGCYADLLGCCRCLTVSFHTISGGNATPVFHH